MDNGSASLTKHALMMWVMVNRPINLGESFLKVVLSLRLCMEIMTLWLIGYLGMAK